MKPFPFAIWPNSIRKSALTELQDMRGGVEKVTGQNLGKTPTDIPNSSLGLAKLALKHRAANLHSLDIDPNIGISAIPSDNKTAQKDIPIMASLERAGGLSNESWQPSGIKQFIADEGRGIDPGKEWSTKDVLYHGTNSKNFLQQGGQVDPKFLTELKTGNSFGNGFYLGDPTKVQGYGTAGTFAYGIDPSAKIISTTGAGLEPGQKNPYYGYVNPLYAEKRNFDEDEQKKIFAFLKDAYLMRGGDSSKFDRAQKYYGSILSYGHNMYAKNSLLGFLSSTFGQDHPDFFNIGPMAMAAIGIDGVEDPRSEGSVVSIFPHSTSLLRKLAQSAPTSGIILNLFQQIKKMAGSPIGEKPFDPNSKDLTKTAIRLFSNIDAEGVQNPPHGSNSVLQHTQLGMSKLNTQGLDDRTAKLLQLAYFLHDVGKVEGAQDSDHPRKSVGIASDYLDAQQNNSFGLTDEERKLVEHLITWHDAYGHVLRQLPPGNRTQKISEIMQTAPRGNTDNVGSYAEIFTDPKTTNLLGRMWQADIEAIPGYATQEGSNANAFAASHPETPNANHELDKAGAESTEKQKDLVESLIEGVWRPTTEKWPSSVDDFTHKEWLGGSTSPQLVSFNGKDFVLKRGNTRDTGHIREEMATAAAYKYIAKVLPQLGINVPDFRSYTDSNGNPVMVSEYIPNTKEIRNLSTDEAKDVYPRVQQGFAADALLGNWDVIGSGEGNVIVDRNGKPYRIDAGGGLRYRARGGMKSPSEWNGEDLGDFWTMRGMPNPKTSFVNDILQGYFGGTNRSQLFKDYKDLSGTLLGADGKIDSGFADEIRKYATNPDLLLPVIQQRLLNIGQMAKMAEEQSRTGASPESIDQSLANQYWSAKKSFVFKPFPFAIWPQGLRK